MLFQCQTAEKISDSLQSQKYSKDIQANKAQIAIFFDFSDINSYLL